VRGAARRRSGYVCELAAKVEPYLRADGTKIGSLMQLERQLRPEVYGRRRGGYVDRRQTRPPAQRSAEGSRRNDGERHRDVHVPRLITTVLVASVVAAAGIPASA
jgi:hypothetical protein